MIHASLYRPKVFPYNGDVSPAEIDRLQELTGSTTLGREKIEEIGRADLVGWKTATPTVSLSLTQLEYGSIEFYQKLANTTATTINLTDFKTPKVDIAGYKTDDDGTFLGTVWYPNCRTAGFAVNIGDPQASIERTFSLAGEEQKNLLYDNKYLIYKEFTASGGSPEVFSVVDPLANEDLDNSGSYLFRVLKVSGGTTTLLEETTDYTYNSGTGDLSITTTAADVIKVYYSSDAYESGQEPFTENDSDATVYSADQASIYLVDTSNYVYRLQSVSVDVSFDRFDVREIGNNQVVATGVNNTTVSITLGRILESFTIEELLRGVGGADYGIIDASKYEDNMTLLIKLYTDNTKTTFSMGYKFTGLAPVSTEDGTTVAEYVNRGVTMEGQAGLISSVEGQIA